MNVHLIEPEVTPESLSEAIRDVRMLTEYAYEQGFHEMGYDPVQVLDDAATTMLAEMRRYLPVLEKLYAIESTWVWMTEGTGIATVNGFRAAIAKATGKQP